MTANSCLLIVFSFGLSFVVGDHSHGYEAAYVYPDPDHYANTSGLVHHAGSGRTRRIFDDEIFYTLSASISFDASIPLPDLNSAVYISVPFSFEYPSARSSSVSASSGRSFSDSGLDSLAGQSPRSALYSGLESSVAHLTGADGHSCLLRAMCEASSTPLHDEGLIGDAITFLLTANYAADEADNKFKKYFAAQAKGQLTGDCSEWHSGCPISLFKLIDNNII